MCIRLALFSDTFQQGIHTKRQTYLLFPTQADSAPLFLRLLLIQTANLQYTIFAYSLPPDQISILFALQVCQAIDHCVTATAQNRPLLLTLTLGNT